MEKNFLQIDVEKTYPGFQIKTKLTVDEGEFLSLVGPSGCGKTTLLRLISGLESPDQGKIILAGSDLTTVPAVERRIGFVFQDYALFPHLTVTGNIEYGLRVRRLPAMKRKERVKELLALFEIEELSKRSIQALSGGERQRVALARALAPEPYLLLLDEPFSALDYGLRRRLRRELKDLQERLGFTTIFVTHQQEEALSLSGRLAVMKEGRIIQTGTAKEIYSNPSHPFVAKFLGDANLIPCSLQLTSNGGIIYLPDGERIPYLASGDQKSGEYLLMVRPEDFFISSSEGVLAGEVINFEYLGYGYYVEVKTHSGIVLKVVVDKRVQDLYQGQFVRLGLRKEAAKLIPINSPIGS